MNPRLPRIISATFRCCWSHEAVHVSLDLCLVEEEFHCRVLQAFYQNFVKGNPLDSRAFGKKLDVKADKPEQESDPTGSSLQDVLSLC